MSLQLIIDNIFNGETFEIFPQNSGTRKSGPSPLLSIVLETVANTLGKGWKGEWEGRRKTNIRNKRPSPDYMHVWGLPT